MTKDDLKSGKSGQLRDSKGRFLPGSKPPCGRPVGAVGKITRLLKTQMTVDAQRIVDQVIDKALSGDLTACQIVLDRLFPKPKDNAIQAKLDTFNGDLVAMSRSIIEAMTSGQITPSEGAALQAAVKSHAQIKDFVEFEERLKRLEGDRQ